jgi:hypothetical protein
MADAGNMAAKSCDWFKDLLCQMLRIQSIVINSIKFPGMQKHTLILANVLLALAISIAANSQSPKTIKEPSEKSKIESFSLKTGSLIRKEFTMIGSVKRVEIKKLVLTDVLTNSSLSGVKLETAISKTYGSTTEACFLDADEVDAFIKSAKYLRTPPATVGIFTLSCSSPAAEVSSLAHFQINRAIGNILLNSISMIAIRMFSSTGMISKG